MNKTRPLQWYSYHSGYLIWPYDPMKQVKYGVRSPKFFWAPCHVMCTAVLIG